MLLVGGAVAFLVAFAITSALVSWDLWPGSADAGLRWDLALLNGTMGLLGTAAVLAAARLAFATWPHITLRLLILPVAGIGIAIAQELVLHEWAEVHVGQYDFDNMLPTAVLSWTTILVAAGCLAVLVAPSCAALVPMLGLTAAVGYVCWIALANAPGLADGIEADSWPLAILIGLAAVYAVGCVVVGFQKLRRG
jgi:hypothetical protein